MQFALLSDVWSDYPSQQPVKLAVPAQIPTRWNGSESFTDPGNNNDELKEKLSNVYLQGGAQQVVAILPKGFLKELSESSTRPESVDQDTIFALIALGVGLLILYDVFKRIG